MYDTAFTDRTLEYGAAAYAPFGQSTPSGPVLGNGNVFIHVDATSTALCSALRTRVGLADTLAFAEFRRETPGPLPPIKSMSLNLANGIVSFRSRGLGLGVRGNLVHHSPESRNQCSNGLVSRRVQVGARSASSR